MTNESTVFAQCDTADVSKTRYDGNNATGRLPNDDHKYSISSGTRLKDIISVQACDRKKQAHKAADVADKLFQPPNIMVIH